MGFYGMIIVVKPTKSVDFSDKTAYFYTDSEKFILTWVAMAMGAL